LGCTPTRALFSIPLFPQALYIYNNLFKLQQ
jgi:hypothetical protein